MGELTIVKDESIKNLEKQLSEVVTKAKTLKVSNDVEAGFASDSMRLLKRLSKQLDDKRKEIVKPAQDEVKRFKAEIDKIRDIADKSTDIIKMVYEPYLAEVHARQVAEEKARRKAEEDRINAEAKALEDQMMEVAAEHNEEALVDQALDVAEVAKIRIDNMNSKEIKTSNVKTEFRAVGFTTTWHAEVTDPAAALRWIADKERFEMVEFKGLAAFARGIKKEGEGNGIKIYSKKEVR